MNVNKYPGYILQNPKLWTPNYRLFKSILQYFRPENSIVAIGSRKLKVSNIVETKDNFREVKTIEDYGNVTMLPMPELEYLEAKYSTPFTIYKIPHSLVKYWMSYNSNNLHLPKYNQLIPQEENFSTLPKHGLNVPMLVNTTSTIRNHSAIKVWILPHTNWKIPIVTVRCELRSIAIEEKIQSAGINSTTYITNYVGNIVNTLTSL